MPAVVMETRLLWGIMELLVNNQKVNSDETPETPDFESNRISQHHFKTLEALEQHMTEFNYMKQEIDILRENNKDLKSENTKLKQDLQNVSRTWEDEKLELSLSAEEWREKAEELTSDRIVLLARLSEQSEGIREQSAEWENIRKKMELTIRELTLEREQDLRINGSNDEIEKLKRRQQETDDMLAEVDAGKSSRLSIPAPPLFERQDSLASYRFVPVIMDAQESAIRGLSAKTNNLRIELQSIRQEFIESNEKFQSELREKIEDIGSPLYALSPTESDLKSPLSVGFSPVSPAEQKPNDSQEQPPQLEDRMAPRIRGMVTIINNKFSQKRRYIEIGLKGFIVYKTKEDHQKQEKPVMLQSLRGVQVFVVDKIKNKKEEGIFKLQFLDGTKVKINAHNEENRDKFVSTINKVIAMNC